MSRRTYEVMLTVERHGEPATLLCRGTVDATYGEDSQGDTVRYEPRVTEAFLISEDSVGTETMTPDGLWPSEEELALDALCERAAEDDR